MDAEKPQINILMIHTLYFVIMYISVFVYYFSVYFPMSSIKRHNGTVTIIGNDKKHFLIPGEIFSRWVH